MSATKQRRTLTDAEKLARRERTALKRLEAYEVKLRPSREFLVEAIDHG